MSLTGGDQGGLKLSEYIARITIQEDHDRKAGHITSTQGHAQNTQWRLHKQGLMSITPVFLGREW